MLKIHTKDGFWIVEDHGRNIIFDNSTDMWIYVFLLREIRPKVPQVERSLYPVLSLDPTPFCEKKAIKFFILT